MSEALDTNATRELPSIERRPTFIIHRLNAELARICNPILRPLGVDLITSRILAMLYDRHSVYIGDVVELMSLPQSTVSHQIKRLETIGLVKRRTDKSDNRAVQLTLTRKGKDIAARCNAVSNALYSELFAGYDQAQLDTLVASLGDLTMRLRGISAGSLDIEPT